VANLAAWEATKLIVMAVVMAVMAALGPEAAAAVPGGIQAAAAAAEVVTVNLLGITVLAALLAAGTLEHKMAAAAVELVFLAKVLAV